jgi:GNAT superfamily N-acetyltransferase
MDPGQIKFRPATQEDVPFLAELRQQTMHPHLRAAGLVAVLEQDMERVMFRFDCAKVILLADQRVGLWKVARDGRDWDLIQVQLAPRMQGQGLGTQLIQSLIVEAREAGASLKLQVLKANPARHLYQRLGFVVTAETQHGLDMLLAG